MLRIRGDVDVSELDVLYSFHCMYVIRVYVASAFLVGLCATRWVMGEVDMKKT